MRHTVFDTAAGPCGLAWTSSGLARFQLPADDAASTEAALTRHIASTRAAPPPAVEALIEAVRRYFTGAPETFEDIPLDTDVPDETQRKIYAATRALPWGTTTTYGGLATQLGLGREAARDIGVAMSRNPVPLIVPCHRVLAAGGALGGFSAPGGAVTKRLMLKLEGVPLPPEQGSFLL
ncbi:cysteine methyltransferase [Pseudoroseomonas deserti]|uniref:Cysteine methyltransferase n=1 Tax=Teichococcus deserti TaxID=1817963 RepID=A0A1V2GZH8_9PROT|nr:methylated-DNA--[protein]-cysteine S-methyltransferase [Pseudoroseomonas deserti]ONG50882.1 cysteine methyltransferase [Pseudoroseomonas deserti]